MRFYLLQTTETAKKKRTRHLVPELVLVRHGSKNLGIDPTELGIDSEIPKPAANWD